MIVNAGDFRFTTLGARKDSTSAAAVLFDGSMKEIIAYVLRPIRQSLQD